LNFNDRRAKFCSGARKEENRKGLVRFSTGGIGCQERKVYSFVLIAPKGGGGGGEKKRKAWTETQERF